MQCFGLTGWGLGVAEDEKEGVSFAHLVLPKAQPDLRASSRLSVLGLSSILYTLLSQPWQLRVVVPPVPEHLVCSSTVIAQVSDQGIPVSDRAGNARRNLAPLSLLLRLGSALVLFKFGVFINVLLTEDVPHTPDHASEAAAFHLPLILSMNDFVGLGFSMKVFSQRRHKLSTTPSTRCGMMVLPSLPGRVQMSQKVSAIFLLDPDQSCPDRVPGLSVFVLQKSRNIGLRTANFRR